MPGRSIVGQARAPAMATAAASGVQRQQMLLRPSAVCRGTGGAGQQAPQWRRRRPSPTPTPTPLLLAPTTTTPAFPRHRLRATPSPVAPPPPPSADPPKKKKGKGWRLLDGGAYLERWDVPWSGGAALGWMLSWFATFALSAFILSPALYFALFPPSQPSSSSSPASSARLLSSLPPSEQAQFALASEAVEASVTAALLGVVAARHAPRGGLSARGLLQLFGPPEEQEDQEEQGEGATTTTATAKTTKQQQQPQQQKRRPRPSPALKAPRGWLGWGLIGAVAAPVVVGATATLLSFLHYDEYFAAGKGTADAVAGMVETNNGDGGDSANAAASSALALVTYFRLFAVTAVLAPLLEESVFRGFLLPSLSKLMPVPLAIVLSSAAFAAAHLSVRDAPVLFTLGCLLGCVYVRSRALASPMLVHGLWNGTVLTVLFALSASGVDLDAMLHPTTGAAGAAGAGAEVAAAAAGPAADVALQWLRAMTASPW